MLNTVHDAPGSDAEWQGLLASTDFGQLIAWRGTSHVPVVVPTHYWFGGEGRIELHLHRANPVWEVVLAHPTVMFAVLDAVAYIPTSWNADPGSDPAWSAPTSYYAAVQAIGRAAVIDDPAELSALLTRQLTRQQPEGGHGPVQPGPTPFGRMLQGVRGLRIDIEAVRAKFKFGGNKSRAHQRTIAEHLRVRGSENDLRARQHLLRRGGAAAPPSPHA